MPSKDSPFEGSDSLISCLSSVARLRRPSSESQELLNPTARRRPAATRTSTTAPEDPNDDEVGSPSRQAGRSAPVAALPIEGVNANWRASSAPARLQHLARIMEAAIALVDQEGEIDVEDEGSLLATVGREPATRTDETQDPEKNN